MSRAFGHGVADGDFDKSIPLEGCIPRAVAEHAGRKHVMAVAFPDDSLPEEVFAFQDSATRDACMQRLQVRACVAVRSLVPLEAAHVYRAAHCRARALLIC